MKPIGIFDSGVGGLSVWREIVRALPDVDTIYVADQAHIPYGPRPMEEIRDLARGITRALLDQGCGTIVVACNTASAASLAMLRHEFEGVAFVGMEPAVKPAAAGTQRGVVGVLATPATFQGELFATCVERFAVDVRIIQQICPGLVERIEAGDLDGADTVDLLGAFLRPSLAAGADTIVLACTHYPFVRPAIEAIAGPRVTVIDPAPAVARQVVRVAAGDGESAPRGTGRAVFFTTGDVAGFERTAAALLGRALRASQLRWRGKSLEKTGNAAPQP